MSGTRVLTPDALAAVLAPDPLDPSDVVAGAPAVSSVGLAEVDGVEIGIWQITEGSVTDTEVDEVFVVLAGRGVVIFEDDETVEVGPGSVVRLRAGERTTWTIHETLRKLYLVLAGPATEEEV